MEPNRDSFKTILKASEVVLYKDRKSKFFGYCFPIQEEIQVKPIIQELKKQHPTANHFCYAWKLGLSDTDYRTNDDGEPGNTAGMPIYRQIQAADLTDLLLVVVRVFGGAKLGASGLIRAYKTTANLALARCEVVTEIIKAEFIITFPYVEMEKVMRIIKSNAVTIIDQQLELEGKIRIAVRKSEASKIATKLASLHKISIKKAG